MSCYHPILAVRSAELNEKGNRKVVPIGRLDKLSEEDIKKNKDSFLIPCGKCIGCRLDYSRYWADRMMLELETAKKGVFLTLTYDNDHIPWINDNVTGEVVYTLNKRDCQLFIKRLRKYYSDIRIRFYLAGEYGPSTKRSHYHCILFGISLDDIGDCVVFGKNELGQFYYISKTIARIWKNGNVLLSDVSWNTCAYVARYVTKKINGKMKDQVYGTSGRLQEFSLMSRNPGIGSKYLEEHPDCLDYQSINISTPDGVRKISIPKYYIQKVKLTNKDKYDKIVSDRKRFANDGILIELQSTSRGMDEYYVGKEVKKYADIRALKRNKVR